MNKTLFTVLFFLHVVISLKSQVSTIEKEALLALYNSTDGDNWTHNSNWGTSSEVSEWYGITVENNQVTSIELPSNNLVGFIPTEIGNLTQLETLSLWGNELTGSIPSELCDCTKLSVLALDDNKLSGSIPSSLGNLTSMYNFWIENNQLEGDITGLFSNWPDLWHFVIGGNNLTGEIDLSNCSNLKWCMLNDTYISLLNVKNGNNYNITNSYYFNTLNNPNLTCIIVDDVNFSSEYWTNIDSNSSFLASELECTTTNIETISSKVNIYPNPTNGIVTICSNEIKYLALFNLQGEKKMERNEANSIDLTNMPVGIYFISIEFIDGTKNSYKVIKK